MSKTIKIIITILSSNTDIVDKETPAPVNVSTTTVVNLPAEKPAIDLTTKIWKWSDSQYKNYERFSLVFKRDNTVSITTDCNGMGGNYIQKGDMLSFNQMMSTMMYCEDSSEQEFSSKIQNVKSFEIRDNKLILKHDGGVLNFQ